MKLKMVVASLILALFVLGVVGLLMMSDDTGAEDGGSDIPVEDLDFDDILEPTDDDYSMEDYEGVAGQQPEITTEARENTEMPQNYESYFDEAYSWNGAITEGATFPEMVSYAEYNCRVNGYGVLVIAREFETTAISREDFDFFSDYNLPDSELSIGQRTVFNGFGELFVLNNKFFYQFVAIDVNITDYDVFYRQGVANLAREIVALNS